MIIYFLKLFRKETAVANLQNIHIHIHIMKITANVMKITANVMKITANVMKITASVMSQSNISLINSITDISGCNKDLEIRNNIFEKLIQLYLRVRSFSLARDKMKSCATTKGLRKEMKKAEQK